MKHCLYKYKKQYYLQLFVVFNFVPCNILFRKKSVKMTRKPYTTETGVEILKGS